MPFKALHIVIFFLMVSVIWTAITSEVSSECDAMCGHMDPSVNDQCLKTCADIYSD